VAKASEPRLIRPVAKLRTRELVVGWHLNCHVF
jgi:hypothetical protein